jgi:hypothetical protein
MKFMLEDLECSESCKIYCSRILATQNYLNCTEMVFTKFGMTVLGLQTYQNA